MAVISACTTILSNRQKNKKEANIGKDTPKIISFDIFSVPGSNNPKKSVIIAAAFQLINKYTDMANPCPFLGESACSKAIEAPIHASPIK